MIRKNRLGIFTEEDLHRHFHSYVSMPQGTSCWLWQGSKNWKGYGYYYPPGQVRPYKKFGAHIQSYWLHKGYFQSSRKLYVCHSCDNPSCVNPFHLFLGSPKDNQDDCVKKGRGENRTKKTFQRAIKAKRNSLGRFI